MKKHIIKLFTPEGIEPCPTEVLEAVDEFAVVCQPHGEHLYLHVDPAKSAWFIECHIQAGRLIQLGTTEVAMDPDEQSEYKANRDVVSDHYAFGEMKKDALRRRVFSNIVVEFDSKNDPGHPLKIIGGQHRFQAISEALTQGINELQGLKIYFALDPEQRYDVQVISNRVIEVSTDLLDRMSETMRGPEFRNWCQKVGLLGDNEDFSELTPRTLVWAE